jgi:hypothetical protein
MKTNKFDFSKMSDDEMYKLIEDFANNTSVAIGGNIQAYVSHFSSELKPKSGFQGMKYEDTQYLDSLIQGATNFLFWMRRRKE